MRNSRNPFIRFPGIIFFAFLFIVTGLIWQSSKVSIDSDPMTLLESDRRHLETYERISSFLDDDIALVISIESDFLFTTSGFEHIRNISPNEIYNLAAQSHVATSFEIPEFTLKTAL